MQVETYIVFVNKFALLSLQSINEGHFYDTAKTMQHKSCIDGNLNIKAVYGDN